MSRTMEGQQLNDHARGLNSYALRTAGLLGWCAAIESLMSSTVACKQR